MKICYDITVQLGLYICKEELIANASSQLAYRPTIVSVFMYYTYIGLEQSLFHAVSHSLLHDNYILSLA